MRLITSITERGDLVEVGTLAQASSGCPGSDLPSAQHGKTLAIARGGEECIYHSIVAKRIEGNIS